MTRVRFAPSPTGSLHIGNALSAVANRGVGDWMLLRIDDTDPARNVPGGEAELLGDLEWLGIEWDEGPVRQSDRAERYREEADRSLETQRRIGDATRRFSERLFSGLIKVESCCSTLRLPEGTRRASPH